MRKERVNKSDMETEGMGVVMKKLQMEGIMEKNGKEVQNCAMDGEACPQHD